MQVQRIPQTTGRSDNLLEGLTQVQSCYPHSYSWLHEKDTDQDQLKEESHRRSLEGFQCKASVSSPMQSGYVTLLASMCDNMQSIANQGGSPELCCSEFLLGFHYLAGLIESWVLWLNLIFSYPHLPRCQVDITWLKTPTLYHMVGLSGVTSSHPESSC